MTQKIKKKFGSLTNTHSIVQYHLTLTILSAYLFCLFIISGNVNAFGWTLVLFVRSDWHKSWTIEML